MVVEENGAVSQKDRELEEARIGALLLEAERRECACIWAAEARGKIIDFRANTSAAPGFVPLSTSYADRTS
jgi:hypothetical protein